MKLEDIVNVKESPTDILQNLSLFQSYFEITQIIVGALRWVL
jgi:hypothetical protein